MHDLDEDVRSLRSIATRLRIMGVSIISQQILDIAQNIEEVITPVEKLDPGFEGSSREWLKLQDSPRKEKVAPLCPTHHIPMVVRNGKRGPFWGCPRYHDEGCRKTVNIDEEEIETASFTQNISGMEDIPF